MKRSLFIKVSRLLMTFAIVAAEIAVAACAEADLAYTMAVNSSGASATVKTTVFLKGHRKRVDVCTVGRSKRRSASTITCPDIGEVITLDNSRHIYKVQPMHSILEMLAFPDFPLLSRGDDAQLKNTDNGITISADGIGPEIIDGMNTYHMTLNLHDLTSKPSQSFNAISIEYWVASLQSGYSIKPSVFVARSDGSTISYDTSGDRDLVQDLTAKMPVRMVVHSSGAKDTVMNLTNYSTNSLSPSLFSPPAKYQLMSVEEFDRTEHISPPETALLNTQN
jgi:hypothetical protein